MTRRGATVWLLMGALTGVGCKAKSTETQGPSTPTDAQRVTLCEQASRHEQALAAGTAANGFKSFEDNGPVDLVFGPQGGHHIEISLEASGFNPGQGEMRPDSGMEMGGIYYRPAGEDPVTIDLQLSVEGAANWSNRYEWILQGGPSKSWVHGLNLLVNGWSIAEAYEDKATATAELTVTLSDVCGTEKTTTTSFLLDVDNIPGLEETGFYYYN